MKNKPGLLDVHTAQKYIDTVTGAAGLTVEYRQNLPAPCTNKKRLLIPSFSQDITEGDLKKLRWWVLHESLHHIKGPDAFDMGEQLGFDARHSPLAAIWNIYEDNRIEKAGAKDYRGDRIILDDGWRTMLLEHEEKLIDVLKNADEDMMKIGAAWFANLVTRAKWSPAAIELEAQFEKIMPHNMREHYNLLVSNKVQEDLGALDETRKGSLDSLNLAKKTYELLWKKSADEHIRETRDARDKQKQKGKDGKGGKGDSEGADETGKQFGPDSHDSSQSSGDDGAGEQGGDGASQTSDLGNPDNKGKSADESSGKKVNYRVFVHSEHVDPAKPGGTGIQLDYAKYKKNIDPYNIRPHYEPCNDIKWINYRTGRASHPDVERHYLYNSNKEAKTIRQVTVHHAENGMPGKGFGNKIRQLLQIRSQARYLGGQKKGKIHFKNVYKAGTPLPSYNERVFRQKFTSDTLDTCVTVLTDLSGSMNGSKLMHAIDSSILLNTSIARSLRIPVEMLAFTEYGSDTFIGIIKEADEMSSDEKIINNFAKASCFMSANADGDAILWAYERLKYKEQKRKILIVISDGSPAASRSGDAYAFTSTVIKQIEDEKKIEIYGIGIMNHNVDQLYKEHVVINRASELEKEVLTLIKRSIFK